MKQSEVWVRLQLSRLVSADDILATGLVLIPLEVLFRVPLSVPLRVLPRIP